MEKLAGLCTLEDRLETIDLTNGTNWKMLQSAKQNLGENNMTTEKATFAFAGVMVMLT